MDTVSVIIPFYNGLGELQGCLEALRAQTYPAEAIQVIAVDNGSSEDAASVRAAHPEVLWLAEPRPGSYLARNRGLSSARGEFVAFTDADCVPDPGWLAEAVAVLKAGPATLVGGRIDYLDSPGRGLNLYELIEEEFFLLNRHQHLVERMGMAATANLVAYRAAFDRVGGFDPALKSMGDGEWVRRATARGEVLRYADAALVRHPRRSAFRPVFRKIRRIAGGRTMLMKKQGASAAKIAADIYGYSIFSPRIQRLAFRFPRVEGRGPRLRMFFLLEFLSLANSVEKLRIWLGGEPYRG